MPLNINEILQGDFGDNSYLPGSHEEPPSPTGNQNNSDEYKPTNPTDLFNFNRNSTRDYVTDKCDVAIIFANGAYHQIGAIGASHSEQPASHEYDQTAKEAVDRQPSKWKEDHLAPPHIQETPTGLLDYRDAMGDLLMY
ncbi:hypothetical protein PtA15_14A382 [Puccinia triticina]|uniref:Uncharacterized protein n=1 Tax=Puccinia triticina TaxID=208348 RepID=A0ABY7D4H9_9BASI|nr:uncharacterized protein PtA15_14A382 [Puccinia triticina]WAQ91498.1 hypothetical protein PtA15_14A382 [Puccinia triticina]